MTQSWVMFIIGHAILSAGAIIKLWVDVQVKLAELDVRVKTAESKDDILFKKLDQISTQLTELSIQLSNKQDK